MAKGDKKYNPPPKHNARSDEELEAVIADQKARTKGIKQTTKNAEAQSTREGVLAARKSGRVGEYRSAQQIAESAADPQARRFLEQAEATRRERIGFHGEGGHSSYDSWRKANPGVSLEQYRQKNRAKRKSFFSRSDAEARSWNKDSGMSAADVLTKWGILPKRSTKSDLSDSTFDERKQFLSERGMDTSLAETHSMKKLINLHEQHFGSGGAVGSDARKGEALTALQNTKMTHNDIAELRLRLYEKDRDKRQATLVGSGALDKPSGLLPRLGEETLGTNKSSPPKQELGLTPREYDVGSNDSKVADAYKGDPGEISRVTRPSTQKEKIHHVGGGTYVFGNRAKQAYEDYKHKNEAPVHAKLVQAADRAGDTVMRNYGWLDALLSSRMTRSAAKGGKTRRLGKFLKQRRR